MVENLLVINEKKKKKATIINVFLELNNFVFD